MAELRPHARAIYSAIYSAIWSAAMPASLEPARGEGLRLEGSRLERRRLEFPTAALARLGEQFLEHDLAAAGVAVRDAEGELIPAAPLRQASVEIVALRERLGDPPFDLLTPLGCLSGAESAQAMLRDFRSRTRILASLGYLYVALDWNDALWCDAAGLATLYCPGAEGLTVPLLRALAADLAAMNDPLAETAYAAAATPASDAIAGGGSDRIGERPVAVAVANSADDQTPDAAAQPFQGVVLGVVLTDLA